MKKILITLSAAIALASCSEQSQKRTQPFPFVLPEEKPDIALSKSMNNVYDRYGASTPQDNELYSKFKFSELEGFDYHDHNGTVTRRDPSRIVKANGKYYMWYTLRSTPTTYMGADKATDTVPSSDWDLCDIGYATSKDGFTWQEQGVAVKRPAKPNPGWRSISTPDVLEWKGKYYLYYQAFSEISGKRGDDCPVALSWADSPDGPWTTVNKVIVENGPKDTWDQYSIHDPQPIVYKDKIYLYYKSDYTSDNGTIRSTGLAMSDDPLGPFVKYEKNPVMSSGHETQMFRFKEGIAAILAKDGHEANTVQYSPDGKNFDIASICESVPQAAGVYDPDAFTNVEYAEKGITWGISHINLYGENRRTILLRFDCDLSQAVNVPAMKSNIGTSSDLREVLRNGLNPRLKEEILSRERIR